ncbi:MAG: hypothetical protein JW843_06165 [Candidatus Aminicenantes bacterium]|nr:hypothetical protein [Candidatus Aminicenantes bacterium]
MNIHRCGVAKSVGAILVLAAGLVIGTGCKSKTAEETAEQAAEKKLSDMVAQATEGNAQVDLKSGRIDIKTPDGGGTITLGGGVWPADIPEEISRFRPGSIRGTSNSETPMGKSWIIVIDGVEAADVDAYIEELKNDGWTQAIASDLPQGKFTQLQMERRAVQLTYAADEKTLTLTILPIQID